MEEQRFRVARRGLATFTGIVAAGGVVIGVMSFVTGQAWWYGSVFLLQAALLGSLAFILGRQTVALTDEEIIATQGFQRQRVAWSDVERVHLDWAAEAAGRDRDVLRVERKSGPAIRSSAAMGMGGSTESSEASRLESALRERATAHGFPVEVTPPSWNARAPTLIVRSSRSGPYAPSEHRVELDPIADLAAEARIGIAKEEPYEWARRYLR